MSVRELKMAETRKKLIQVARRAFGEYGYADTSMDKLTAEAGLTRGALYHHFGDKKGLFAAVVATGAVVGDNFCMAHFYLF